MLIGSIVFACLFVWAVNKYLPKPGDLRVLAEVRHNERHGLK